MSKIKDIFGGSKEQEQVWRETAKEIGGKFIKKGGLFNKGVLKYQYKEWELLLDTFTQSTGQSATVYTRLRVPFINKDDFRFTIYRENFFTKIGKFFGLKDTQVWDKKFDEAFVIKSNNEFKVKQFLSDQELKTLLYLQPKIKLEIRNDEGWLKQKYPDNVNLLNFECHGVIKDKEALRNLLNLILAVLDRFVEVSIAEKDHPGIQL